MKFVFVNLKNVEIFPALLKMNSLYVYYFQLISIWINVI
jgi:hypothetical protein